TTVIASAGKATGAAAKKAPIKKTQLNPTEERGSALQKIAKLDIKGRIQLAMKGTKEERSLLIRDGTKIVALAVLESPKISDGEVERFATQKNVLDAAKHCLQHILLGSESFHLAVADLGGFQHRQGDNLGAIADEQGAFFLGAFHGQLNPPFDVQLGNLLQSASPFLRGVQLSFLDRRFLGRRSSRLPA